MRSGRPIARGSGIFFERVQSAEAERANLALFELNRIKQLFGIQHPIIQAGMIWQRLGTASAVSNAGGSASLVRLHVPRSAADQIRKCKWRRTGPSRERPVVSINRRAHGHNRGIGCADCVHQCGQPKTWTEHLKSLHPCGHVVSSVKFALKAQAAGVDAVVAEGFEAGPQRKEETTTFCLVPSAADALDVPVIAAGGIGDARAIVAAFALAQRACRLVADSCLPESSAHQAFKDEVVESGRGATRLSLKALTPVWLLDNAFAREVVEAENAGQSPEE